MTLFIRIRDIVTVDGTLALMADINGVEWSFDVPVGTSFGDLKNYISSIVVDEVLPAGWQREFTI